MDFENPTEKEPRYPSLEEIKNQIERLSGRENLEVIRTVEDEKGIYFHEATYVDERGNTELYAYSRKGRYEEVKNNSTFIDVTYFKGKLKDGECESGKILSDYDELSGEWKDQWQ